MIVDEIIRKNASKFGYKTSMKKKIARARAVDLDNPSMIGLADSIVFSVLAKLFALQKTEKRKGGRNET